MNLKARKSPGFVAPGRECFLLTQLPNASLAAKHARQSKKACRAQQSQRRRLRNLVSGGFPSLGKRGRAHDVAIARRARATAEASAAARVSNYKCALWKGAIEGSRCRAAP